MIYITSDTHFNHKNIIDYCARPFYEVNQMNKKLIENWNSVVKNNDTVYHLGDVGFGDLTGVREQLSGTVNHIRGNHDTGYALKTFTADSLQHYAIIEYNNVKVLLIHYPVYRIEYEYLIKNKEYDVCLYGHVHHFESGWIEHNGKFHKNMSVEVNEYIPQSMEDILNSLEEYKSAKIIV